MNTGSELSFDRKVREMILPSIENMIEKEKEHLEWLEGISGTDDFIENSKENLAHLLQRYDEYIKYLKTNFNQEYESKYR